MTVLELYQQQKEKIEKELVPLFSGWMNAGIATAGDYQNKINLLEKQLEAVNVKIADMAKQEVVNVGVSDTGIKVIKMFLASSAELKPERDQFEIFINRENNELIKQKTFLRLTVWEDFIDAVSAEGLQKEYNKAIRDCDVFVSLFATKAGLYTGEEFNTALVQFKEKGRPLVYTYFKDRDDAVVTNLPEADSLVKFKSKLSELGHYYTTFSNIYDLKYQFKMQLQKIVPLLK